MLCFFVAMVFGFRVLGLWGFGVLELGLGCRILGFFCSSMFCHGFGALGV